MVLFDVGNVIVRATHAITYAILADLGVKVDVAPQFFHHANYAEFSRGRITGKEFSQLTRARLRSSLTNDQIRCAHDAHIYAVDEEVVAVLRALQSRHALLAFATDTNEWQAARVAALVPLHELGRAFQSHELGALKSDGGVFERILGELRISPRLILFVDDSSEKCERAAALGMVTHQFTSAAALRRELVRLGFLV